MTKIKLEKRDVMTMIKSSILKTEEKMLQMTEKCRLYEFNYLTGKNLKPVTIRNLLGLWKSEEKAGEYLSNLRARNSKKEFVRIICVENNREESYGTFCEFCDLEEQLEELKFMKRAFSAHMGTTIELSLEDFKKMDV
jgi:hypothetical protein